MAFNDTVVICGVSGRIAAANNVDEFERCLYNGVDLVCEDDRWPKDFYGLCNKIGKMSDFSSFDAEFFGINDQDADLIDPQVRVLIEVIFESICDAGETMQTIRGSRTGIFYGSFFNEIDRSLKAEDTEFFKLRQSFLGWTSYVFDVTGPCYMYETACSSSSTATVEAFNAMKQGLIDCAIIATSNTNYSPSSALAFQKLGLTSTEGKCRFLDANASGYVKSDAATAFLLRRESKAKRIYARILSAVSTADGYKSEGITYPKWTAQRDTINDAYRKTGIDPLTVNFVEAHGTGTQVGDAQEVKAIYEAFKVKDRQQPLLLGSVKTNTGHAEGASGLSSILKVIFTFKNKCIPKSIHFSNPNTNIEPLMKGEITPVISNTPFDGRIVGVNSFGFGGSNVHLIIGAFEKENKENNYDDKDGKLSRLVLFCGRTEERVDEAFDKIVDLHLRGQLTREYLSLVNDYSKMPPESGMKSRGYLILSNEESVRSSSSVTAKRPLYIFFGGLGQQLKAMAAPFMRFNAFAKSIKKSVEIVDPLLNINLLDILTNEKSEIDINKSIISLIPIAAFLVAMIDLFIDLGVQPDGYLGHSFGEFSCAYFDGALTQEQYLLAAIAIYKCTTLKGISNGLMAATDMSREEFEQLQRPHVYLACDNSEQSVTIAGKTDAIEDLVNELRQKNRFVRLVKTGGFAFHCPLTHIFMESIRTEFRKVISQKHTMSSKWISTSIKNFNHDLVKEEYVSTYLSRVVSDTVNFRDAMKTIPNNAVVVEISARKFLTPLLTRSLPSSVSMLNVYNETGVAFGMISDKLLELFGSIYEHGFDINIDKLYPPVSYPFDCTTPSLSPLIKLNHSKPRLFRKYPEFFNPNSTDDYNIDISTEKWSFLVDHKINGEIVVPFSLYVYFIWDFISKQLGQDLKDIAIAFENITLYQKLVLKDTKTLSLNLSFIEENGKFKIAIKENANLIITSFVRIIENIDYNSDKCDHKFDNERSSDEIYSSLADLGYQFGENFKQIVQISKDFMAAKLIWTQNLVTFLESLFQFQLIANQNRVNQIVALNYIESLQIDAKQFTKKRFVHVHYDKYTNETYVYSQSSQTSLLIRNMNYTQENNSPANGIFPQISAHNHGFIRYVSIGKNQSDICSLLGVSGRHANKQKFIALIFNDRKRKELTLDPLFTWNIPEKYSLSESASIAVPYCTAYYSLLIRGNLKEGEYVMVLDGYSPIGIAAITICLDFGCNVSVTVENLNEKNALIDKFPQLNENSIYFSKENDIEELTKRSTMGNGFDLMLSSSFDDSMQSKLRLIALNGRYLQVMSPTTHVNAMLGLHIFLRNIAVHGIQLSSIISTNDNEFLKTKKQLHQLVDSGLRSGVVRLLPRCLQFGDTIDNSCFNTTKSAFIFNEKF